MISVEKKVSSVNKFNGRIFAVKVDSVELEDGTITSREVVEHNGGATIIAITNDNKIALVRQYRYCFSEALYELPAGKLEVGELPVECAIRELREEVGATADNIIELGYIIPTPAYDTEKIYIFLARNIIVGANQLDEGEYLDVEFLDIMTAYDMVLNNIIKDSKTIIGIMRAKDICNL